jgi:hypothetical protein
MKATRVREPGGTGVLRLLPGRIQADLGENSRYLQNGNLRIVVTSSPLAEAMEAHRATEGRVTVGKLTLLT